LDLIANDDPVTCAEYARNNGLLDTPGWKRFKRYAKIPAKVERMANQAKLRSYRRDPFWQLGYLTPRTHAQAVEIDKAYGNSTLWQEAEAMEMKQLLEYKTFIDQGKVGAAPTGYRKI
jgi:hypothetical protein